MIKVPPFSLRISYRVPTLHTRARPPHARLKKPFSPLNLQLCGFSFQKKKKKKKKDLVAKLFFFLFFFFLSPHLINFYVWSKWIPQSFSPFPILLPSLPPFLLLLLLSPLLNLFLFILFLFLFFFFFFFIISPPPHFKNLKPGLARPQGKKKLPNG